MELSKQFDILEALAEANASLSQRELERITHLSLGTVNRILKKLTAGFDSRMVPITFNTSKSLVRVHGVRIIDHPIDACLLAGISEFYHRSRKNTPAS